MLLHTTYTFDIEAKLQLELRGSPPAMRISTVINHLQKDPVLDASQPTAPCTIPSFHPIDLQETQRIIANPYIHRPVATQKLTPADSYEILVAQRKHRPTSPNLGIYKMQMTMFCSGMNRITGLTVAVPFYLFSLTYLASPLLGLHLDSATLASAFGALPVAAKVGLKFAAALPFTFHSFNGIRHIIWDTGRAFNNQTVINTGWVAIGSSLLAALYLAVGY